MSEIQKWLYTLLRPLGLEGTRSEMGRSPCMQVALGIGASEGRIFGTSWLVLLVASPEVRMMVGSCQVSLSY